MSTTTLNQENIIKKVYDPATETLKVNAIATIAPGILEITISDTDDSIKIGDGGGDYLAINPDGSISVQITDSQTNSNVFNEVTGIVSGITTQILSYTMTQNGKLVSVDFAGTNVAMYSLYINGTLSSKKYTYWGDFNGRFEMNLAVSNGDIIIIEVLHMRPTTANFNANFIIGT